MNISFWSDENRLFVRKTIGFGWSINLKYISRKLGFIKGSSSFKDDAPKSKASNESREERLRRQVEASKYEDRDR